MPLAYDAGFNRKAAEESGCKIEGHSITFQGICRGCMKKSRKNRPRGPSLRICPRP
jgi:hypothetical protein